MSTGIGFLWNRPGFDEICKVYRH